MSELFPLVLAQAGTGLVALGVSGLGWWRASRASKALKESFSAHEVSNAEIERFLMALSQAEREGTTAMLQVLENHTSKPAEYFRSLAAGERKAITKALVQPSDEGRKRFIYRLAAG